MTTRSATVPIPKNGVDYRGKIVLAPMVRSGELPSRLLALKYGADLVWGPETVDKSLIGTTRHYNEVTSTVDFTRPLSNGGKVIEGPAKESLIYRLHPELESRRLIFQIGTANPETAVKAADLVAADVAGIDVNAGCPKPFSTLGGMGAALLKDPERLSSILHALVKEVGQKYEIGISVKIRLLETPEKTEALVRQLCQTGITGLTVHCRTTPMRPREKAIRDQLRLITSLCKEAGVACLMNGDVRNRDEAILLAEQYGADGAMIATAAESNSSCFRKEVDGGLAPWREVVTEYVKLALQVHNRYGNTKFLLAQLMPGKTDEARNLSGCKSYRQICEMLRLEDVLDMACYLDAVLGIDEDRESKAMKKTKNKVLSRQSKPQSIRHEPYPKTIKQGPIETNQQTSAIPA